MKNLIVNIFKTLFFFDLALILIAVIPDYKTENLGYLTLWREGIAFLVVGILSVIFYKKVEKEPIPPKIKKIKKDKTKKVKNKKKGKFKFILLGLFTGALIPALYVGAMWILKGYNFVCFNKIPQIWVWIIAIFLNAAAGELLIRGYLFRLYKKFYGFIIATVVTTALFVSMHSEILDMNRTYFWIIILLNLLLCFLLEYTKTIYFTVFARFTYTFISGFMFGGNVFVQKYPTFANFVFKGKPKFTGGDLMVEGSMLTLILLSVTVFLMFAFKYKIWHYFSKTMIKKYIFNIKRFFINLWDFFGYILYRIKNSFRIIRR